MLDHCGSDDSWEPPEGQGDLFDFCYEDSHSSEVSEEKSFDVDASHPDQSISQACSSSSESTRAATANLSSRDIAGHSVNHVFSAPHTQTTACDDVSGNKKRKQGMGGYQASEFT